MKTILYLGLNPPPDRDLKRYIHYPVIETIARPLKDPWVHSCFEKLHHYSHLIFTSQMGVHYFFSYLKQFQKSLDQQLILSIGQKTTSAIQQTGHEVFATATEEHQEGLIALIQQLPLVKSHFLWPRSALSRPVLKDFMREQAGFLDDVIFYETVYRNLAPFPLELIDEIHFTSPSTVEAFLKIYGHLPMDKNLTAIGPITEKKLSIYIERSNPTCSPTSRLNIAELDK